MMLAAATLPTYTCPKVASLVVDGDLSKPAWRAAPAVRLLQTVNGRYAPLRTTVRICYSDTHLYVAFESSDPDIWGTFADHDDPLYDEEVVEAFLSPSHLTDYYEIEVSPRNVRFDAAIRSPDLQRRTMETDLAWTCAGLLSAVRATAPVHTSSPTSRLNCGPRGTWTAEIGIPFASLPGATTPALGDEWRANFYRIDRGKRDAYLAWSPTMASPADFHVPERFGILRFGEPAPSAAGLLPPRAPAQQWSPTRASEWYRRQPRLLGCNLIPSTAVNQLEMWQADAFDPDTIDRELGWAASLGMNCVRVYLHDLAWHTDRDGFCKRMRRFLAIAASHRIRPMFVLFDDCWNPNPAAGPQPPPRPGVHNSRWLQSPGRSVVLDSTQWERLRTYVTGVIGEFARDRRVLAWDLYNEPGNSDMGELSLPLLKQVFGWARSAGPTQPLTVGIWFDNDTLNQVQIAMSDIVTFHNYNDAASLRTQIEALRSSGRPVICTEWMARPTSTIATHLDVFAQTRVGCMNWGLVAGKTQTMYPWGSKPGAPEPATWFHDLLRPDGSPYNEDEAQALRRYAGQR